MIFQSEPVTMWFDRRLVLRQSPIQGIGTFTIEAIPAGQLLVLVSGGPVFTSADWQAGRVRVEAEMYNQEALAENVYVITPKAFNTSFANVSHQYASEGQVSQLLGLVIGKEQIIEGPTEQTVTFHRPMPVYPIRSRNGEVLPYFCALEDAFADWVIDPAVPICPHRGLPLDGLVDENGVAICSGHGLARDMKTGKCVRRFSSATPLSPS